MNLNDYLEVFRRVPTFNNYTLWGTLNVPAGTKGYREFVASLAASTKVTFIPSKKSPLLKPQDIKSWKANLVIFEASDQVPKEMIPVINSRNTLHILSLKTVLDSRLVSLEVSYVAATET